MDNYQEAYDKIKTAVEGIEMLRKAAFKQYSFLVDEVVHNRITDQHEIERIMDGLIDFGDYEEFLNIYKVLCRHVFYTYPEMVGEHVALWRIQFSGLEDNSEEETQCLNL